VAGALTDPVDRAVLVFHTPERSTVEEFVRNDPYVVNDLVTSWTVRDRTVVVGEGAAGP
jgi:hypothetical protein